MSKKRMNTHGRIVDKSGSEPRGTVKGGKAQNAPRKNRQTSAAESVGTDQDGGWFHEAIKFYNARAEEQFAAGNIVAGIVDKTGVFAMEMLPHSWSGVPLMFVGGTEARGVKILQYGKRTLKESTAQALNKAHGLNLNRHEWGRAVEKLKGENGLPPNFHGNIAVNGDYTDHLGKIIDNIINYLP